jgi:hypothetical protein
MLLMGLKYLNSLIRIRDPGWRQFRSGIRHGKKSDPGSRINIPDPPHWQIHHYDEVFSFEGSKSVSVFPNLYICV